MPQTPWYDPPGSGQDVPGGPHRDAPGARRPGEEDEPFAMAAPPWWVDRPIDQLPRDDDARVPPWMRPEDAVRDFGKDWWRRLHGDEYDYYRSLGYDDDQALAMARADRPDAQTQADTRNYEQMQQRASDAYDRAYTDAINAGATDAAEVQVAVSNAIPALQLAPVGDIAEGQAATLALTIEDRPRNALLIERDTPVSEAGDKLSHDGSPRILFCRRRVPRQRTVTDALIIGLDLFKVEMVDGDDPGGPERVGAAGTRLRRGGRQSHPDREARDSKPSIHAGPRPLAEFSATSPAGQAA